jgi:urease accessory protein UreE
MLALAPTMSPCHMLGLLLKQRLIATKVVTTMQTPTLKTLMELFTTKTFSLKDTNFTKLNQSKSKSMRRVTTGQGPSTDLSLKTKTKILRTESTVLLAERKMAV